MRTWIVCVIVGVVATLFAPLLAAQNNPVPFVNNPVVPEAIAPGGQGFMLTVNGAGFVNGSVVKWNGSSRKTTFVSPTQLTAAISPSDIALAVTVFITVLNPGPGGGLSNAVFFQVTTPTATLAYSRTDSVIPLNGASTIQDPTALTVLDATNAGIGNLAVTNGICPAVLECETQKASISFSSSTNVSVYQTFTGASPQAIGTGDFNGDGFPDLLTISFDQYSVLLNMSNEGSTFPLHNDYPLPENCAFPFVSGDFHGDGHLDLVMTGSSGICILPGNGDGTFGSSINADLGTVSSVGAVGDFNGDGKLDLAVTNVLANTISILLGNGDGTFQPPIDYAAGPSPQSIVAADLNDDGKTDLAVMELNQNVSIYLGNGDGTFQPKVDYSAGIDIQSMTVGDYNGDGILDLAVSDHLCSNSVCPANGSVNVLLGNGDGTFQSPLNFAADGEPGPIATGSFDFSDGLNVAAGRPGFATVINQQNLVSVFDAITNGTLNAIPTISFISPSSAPVDSGAFTLSVTGTNFTAGSTVYFNGQPRVTTLISPTQLTAAILASDLASNASVGVVVINPPPGGGGSTLSSFNVFAPSPTISSLNPTSVVAGGPGFTLIINGANFVSGAVVNFNGNQRSTAFVSSTQVTIELSSGDIASQGTINISVTVPAGDGSLGGTTASLPLTILPITTQPVVGALIPASATAGGPGFTLTLTGSGFTASSVVTFNSIIVSSAYVSATELQAAIPASAIAVAGTPLVTVSNPGGIPSVVVTFTVNNDYELSVAMASPPVTAGSPATFSLLVTPTSGTTTNSVTFAVMTALPAGTTASFSPSATIPAGSGITTVTLSITTSPHTAFSSPRPHGGPVPPLGALSLCCGTLMMLLIFLWRRGFMVRSSRAAISPLLIVLLIVTAGLASCGGVTSPPTNAQLNPATGTPAGTYMIVVTATSGNSSLMTTVTLTVM